MEEKKENKSRRGLTKYRENPFLMIASSNTKGGVRKIEGKTDDRLMVVSEDTGERLGGAGFFKYQEVDKTQFLKLYINGVKAITELSSAGTKVFEVLYRTVQENKDSDKIFMAFDLVDQSIVKIARATIASSREKPCSLFTLFLATDSTEPPDLADLQLNPHAAQPIHRQDKYR